MYFYGLLAYGGSAVIGGVLAISLLTKHDWRQPAFAFGLFMFSISFWAAIYIGYLTASTESWLLFFTMLTYLSVVSAPVTWFVFALRYTDRSEWLSTIRVGLLLVVPVGVLGLVFTVPFHSLFYTEITVITVDGVELLETTGGLGHTINIIYAYGLLLVGSGLIVSELFTTNRLYQRQSVVLLACLSAPWVANGLFHLGFQPIPTADLTPVVFVLVGIPLAVIVHRAELTGFVPVAHEQVFHTLEDPVFVVSPKNRILDANRTARSLVTETDSETEWTSIEGTHIAAALPETLLENGSLNPELETTLECELTIDGRPRQYIARLRGTDSDHRDDPRGTIVSLTDITLQKTQQERLARKNSRLATQTTKLEAKNEQLERLAGVVSHDLATPLATGESLLHLIKADLTDPPHEVQQSLADLETVHGRLRTFAEALPALARESTDVATPTDCDLETVVRAAWRVVDTADLELDVQESCQLSADPNRLQQAFENLFQNCADHGSATTDAASTVTVGLLSSTQGFYIEDDGPGIPVDRREDLLEFGVSTGTGSGYGLAIVRTIVEAHSWVLSVTESTTGGARFDIITEPFDPPEH